MTFREEIIGDARLTWIYALCDPSLEPRYVGKTVRYIGERHKAHIREAKKDPRLPVHRWLRKRMDAGERLIIWALEVVASDADWADRERYWIERFRGKGYRLLNLTSGGEGLAGYIPTQEHRDKIARAIRTGAEFRCERCQNLFWRKRNEIKAGDCRFCSRTCYAASLRGVSRPVSDICTERGVAAAAAKRAAQSHCKRGHPLSGDNLFRTTAGSRGCKQCRRLHKLTYRARQNG